MIAAVSNDTARIEAFSDGVFAIAITLLVLDLKVPRELHEGQTLTSALAHQWPAYVAFVTSFLTILVMWINHHRMFTLIGRADDRLLIFNGLLLLGITVVPFPTSLVAEYLGHDGQRTAALVYNGTFIAIAICFNLLWHCAASNSRLLDNDASPSSRRQSRLLSIRAARLRCRLRPRARQRQGQPGAESRPRPLLCPAARTLKIGLDDRPAPTNRLCL